MRKKGMLQWFMRKKDISVFWIHLFMMLCVLSLAMATMLLSNHLSARALMEENLKKTADRSGPERDQSDKRDLCCRCYAGCGGDLSLF